MQSGLPSFSRHCALSLQCYASLHQFSASKITIPQPLLTKVSSHPLLSPPLLFICATLLSHSPFPNLNILPFYPPMAYTSFSSLFFYHSQFFQVRYTLSHDLVSLNTFPLIPLVLLSILMALYLLMGLVSLCYSPPGTSNSSHQTCLVSLQLNSMLSSALTHLLSYPSPSFVIFTDFLNALS